MYTDAVLKERKFGYLSRFIQPIAEQLWQGLRPLYHPTFTHQLFGERNPGLAIYFFRCSA